MILEQVPIGPMANFGYVIGDSKSKEGAVVDPGWEAQRLLDAAKKHGLKITKIILTHTHFDHVKALGEMVEKTGAQIVLHEDELFDASTYADDFILVNGGETLSLGNLHIEIIHTPGHTPGGICLLMGKKMITGDTLFVGGCGRVDLPGSDPEEMFHSLQKLKSMDDSIEIYPGHDYGSTPHSSLGHEKKHNPFLLPKTLDEFFGRRLT